MTLWANRVCFVNDSRRVAVIRLKGKHYHFKWLPHGGTNRTNASTKDIRAITALPRLTHLFSVLYSVPFKVDLTC